MVMYTFGAITACLGAPTEKLSISIGCAESVLRETGGMQDEHKIQSAVDFGSDIGGNCVCHGRMQWFAGT